MPKVRRLQWIFYLLCLLTLTLLNGCSTTGRKDGPPPFNVDISKIPDAVPKKEALSKYGNYSSYRVFGRNYHTMSTASAKNYEERGIASWYGTKFHAQRTSSGERYNMLAMTAAHKTLPLPTYVQVTNLANGHKVVVKVNDRGPFEANRLIDLSYVAAKKLGMTGHGTAYVDVKAIDPNHMPTDAIFVAHNTKNSRILRRPVFAAQHYPITTQHIGSKVYLQVGAFKNRALAEKLKNRLVAYVSSPIRITLLTRTSKRLYRVQIGPIKDTMTADNITKRLKSIGINSEKTTV